MSLVLGPKTDLCINSPFWIILGTKTIPILLQGNINHVINVVATMEGELYLYHESKVDTGMDTMATVRKLIHQPAPTTQCKKMIIRGLMIDHHL